MVAYLPTCQDGNCTSGSPCGSCQTVYIKLNDQTFGQASFEVVQYIDGDGNCVFDYFDFEWGGATWIFNPITGFPWSYVLGTPGGLPYGLYWATDLPLNFLPQNPLPFSGTLCWTDYRYPDPDIQHTYSINADYSPVDYPPLPTTDPCYHPDLPPDNP
jgi:hypothetical protein